MTTNNQINKTNSSQPKNGEINLLGTAVSRGVGIGKIVSLFGKKRQFYRIDLEVSKIEKEIRRFRAAIRLAKLQLKKISSQSINGNSQSGIFQTHLLFLEDKSLLEKIEETIKSKKVNAEWAVKVVTDKYISTYKNIPDEHLRERYIDLEDISERILTALGGGQKANIRLDKNSIILAKELKPSTLIELIKSSPKAIITENGGWTSHTFILARELNIPAVTAIKGVLRRLNSGETVVVDGFNGNVIFNPKKETVKKFRQKAEQIEISRAEKIQVVKGDLKTLDGHIIKVHANLDLASDYTQAKKFGAVGIGLYRSEFLFNQNKGFPKENEQVESYRKIAKLVGDGGVKIRTFDLSIDQLAYENVEKEKNPALGLRAVRLSLTYERQFRTQLRALLRASFDQNIDIVLPMISDISEIHRAKKILAEEAEKLARRKIRFGQPKLGAMIEVPAAIFTVEEIIREVDFVNLGTNDLVQYLLAVDRDNELVSEWFRTLHPAVLRSVKKVIEAGEKFDKPVIICGEMAGSPVYAAILVGLGATELSMNLNSILRVRKIVSQIAFEEAGQIYKALEKCSTSAEIEAKVRESFLQKWAHLFNENDLPA
ncbi:MAG: phosphoenolpyruvate--protein phosphotransferase [Pyrinomonadaceae bacterium]